MDVAKVTITRQIDDTGTESVTVDTTDNSDGPLSPIESLGLLEYARIAISADVLDSMN